MGGKVHGLTVETGLSSRKIDKHQRCPITEMFSLNYKKTCVGENNMSDVKSNYLAFGAVQGEIKRTSNVFVTAFLYPYLIFVNFGAPPHY